MTPHQTLEAARAHAASLPDPTKVKSIAEVELSDGTTAYVLVVVPFTAIKQMHSRKPAAGVRRFVREMANLERERCQTERENRFNRIPGLRELEAALADEDRYQDEFVRMMEDENNDGVRPPHRPQVSSTEVAAQYPLAALYVQVRDASHSAHPAKATAYGAVRDAIEAGASLTEARQMLTEAEAQWSREAQASVDRS